MKHEILTLFPKSIQQILSKEIHNKWHLLQEIRLRFNQPIELIYDHNVQWINNVLLTTDMSHFVLQQLSEHSLYRLQDELQSGFITMSGGHRVGIAGEVSTVDGQVHSMSNITFFNIRIAKEMVGLANNLQPYIYDQNYLNTLIIGAPQTGKTTIIRDIARLIGSKRTKIKPKKVCIIDERSEIAAANHGVPQHNIGLRTDVMDACPKAVGMMMAIRSLSPEILIVDEIGTEEDVRALLEAINAGVTVICTIHGKSLTQLKKRPTLVKLFQNQLFDRYITLQSNKQGKIKAIYNEYEENLLRKSRLY